MTILQLMFVGATRLVASVLDGMNDYLSLLPQTLQWVSETLDGLTGVPWPLWIGGLFPVYLTTLMVLIWTLRGSVWPVSCAYPITKKRRPCRMIVPGEWYRCRHHNSIRSYNFGGGHTVNPRIPRWQQVDGRRKLVDKPAIGVGVLRTRPAGRTLLYQNGYARTPRNVLTLLPEFTKSLLRRLKAMRLRQSDDDDEASSPPGDPDAVVTAEGALATDLHVVVSATRFALIMFATALLITLVAVLLDGTPQAVVQWIAVLGFVLAWAALNSGVRLRELDWLSEACKKSLSWWLRVFAPVALINVFVTFANQ